MSNSHLRISEYTQSFKHLFGYALPYALGYTLLPYLLEHLHFMLGGFLLTILVIIGLNSAVIIIFRRRQQRILEKIECSRIALLSMGLTLVISTVAGALYFNSIDFPWLQVNDSDLYKMVGIAGVIAFIINYAVTFYSLWLMQKFWKK